MNRSNASRVLKGEKAIDFVTLASHALRTPLSETKWYLEIVRSQKIGPLNPRQLDFLNEAYGANERMVHIINDLLLVMKIQEKKLELTKREINMGSVFDDVIKEFSSEKNVSKKTIYNYCYASNIPGTFVDVDRMKHVVRNLISNAVIYTPSEGGVITIGCERKGNEVVYSVTDTGVGIARKDFKLVFKKFFRSKHVITIATNGLGLGLYIAKSIIEAHGGSMWFESVEGKGSTFYFSLPISTSGTKNVRQRRIHK